MNKELKLEMRDVRIDGYPAEDENTIFFFDGCFVSGWPLNDEHLIDKYGLDKDGFAFWEANEDVGHNGKFVVRLYAVISEADWAALIKGEQK